ncbi:MAG: class I SAM-dependent methyltransferase [Candidatus Moranbacteria bacterium]|nr:class I SAM-dependent methyltransferase [Candidatus Moranbacteria bacterium]
MLNLSELNDIYFNKKTILKENLSASVLSNLLDGTYLPITDSSIDLSSLRLILNDIVVNNRRNIIEFGSGISTVVFARLFKKNEISGKIYSVDESEDWIKILKKIIKKESLEEYVVFINAPLKKNKNTKSLGGLRWYDEDILNQKIENCKFDLVFVDGPCAYKESIKFSRYPALPFIYKKLNSRFSVFLDDADRSGEKKS